MTSERSIHLAARHSLESVKDVLAKEPQAHKSKDEDGRVAIHHAVTARRADVVEYLLSKEVETPTDISDEVKRRRST